MVDILLGSIGQEMEGDLLKNIFLPKILKLGWQINSSNDLIIALKCGTAGRAPQRSFHTEHEGDRNSTRTHSMEMFQYFYNFNWQINEIIVAEGHTIFQN